MFTGIIQGLGDVTELRRQGVDCRLSLRPRFRMENIVDGESIAVNGVCLSVERHGDESFEAFASAETLARTTLGALRPGESVNLERALAVGERLGGHIVSGHVDCVAIVRSLSRTGQSARFRLAFDRRFSPEIITKGSVALDGISLTINDCGPGYLEVNIIPDTQKRTNMHGWRIGTRVNMETDIIGKYVQKLLAPWQTGSDTAQRMEKLLQNGVAF